MKNLSLSKYSIKRLKTQPTEYIHIIYIHIICIQGIHYCISDKGFVSRTHINIRTFKNRHVKGRQLSGKMGKKLNRYLTSVEI